MLFYCWQLQINIILLDKLNMIPAKPLDRVFSKYKISTWKILRKNVFDSPPPLPPNPYVINEWPPMW